MIFSLTTNGLDPVVIIKLLIVNSVTKFDLAICHAADIKGIFGTMNESNWCPADISGRKSNDRYSYIKIYLFKFSYGLLKAYLIILNINKKYIN